MKKVSIKRCKQCLTPRDKKKWGSLQDFCSKKCKKAHRSAYNAALHKKNRDRKKTGCTVARMSSKHPTQVIDFKGAESAKNGGSRTFSALPENPKEKCRVVGHDLRAEGSRIFCARCNGVVGKKESDPYAEYGSKIWFETVKQHCSNFQFKEKGDSCLSMAAPYKAFRMRCSECKLGIAILDSMVRKNLREQEQQRRKFKVREESHEAAA